MKLLLQLLFHVTVVTSIGADGNHASSSSQAPKLPHRSDLKVKRTLLESVYPEFSTFKGDMHAGLLPAVLIDDETSNSEDFSSYMFWLFQPDPDATVEVSVEMFSMLHLHIFLMSSIAQLHIISMRRPFAVTHLSSGSTAAQVVAVSPVCYPKMVQSLYQSLALEFQLRTQHLQKMLHF